MPQFTPPQPAYVAPEPPKGKGLAVLALILGLCGLIPLLGWLTGFGAIVVGVIVLATGRPGKGMAIGGMVAGVLLPIVVAGVGVAYYFWREDQRAKAPVPPPRWSNEFADPATCVSNLSNLGSGIALYRRQHADKWPADLMSALTTGGSPAMFVRCPSANQRLGRSSDYFYLAPKDDDQPDRIIVCDLKGNHRGKRNVLSASMNVRQLTESEFQAELARPENAAFAAALEAAEGRTSGGGRRGGDPR
jgi:hypothetical protein